MTDTDEFITRLDEFIEREIAPLEREHPEFFDHRREWARTDWERDGVHRREWLELLAEARRRADAAGVYRYAQAGFGFNLTEPLHGSDATWLETRAVRDGGDWVINGAKRFASGAGLVEHAIVFARTSGEPGQARRCVQAAKSFPSTDYRFSTRRGEREHAATAA